MSAISLPYLAQIRNLHYQGALYPHFMVIYEQRTTEQEANL
jgi:hypothetical protein